MKYMIKIIFGIKTIIQHECNNLHKKIVFIIFFISILNEGNFFKWLGISENYFCLSFRNRNHLQYIDL